MDLLLINLIKKYLKLIVKKFFHQNSKINRLNNRGGDWRMLALLGYETLLYIYQKVPKSDY